MPMSNGMRVKAQKIGGGTLEGVIVAIETPKNADGPAIAVVRDSDGGDWRCASYEPSAPEKSVTVSARTLPTDSAARKRYPMASGLLDYFPDALAEVSYVSWVGNQKHNPGEPLHHARGKSMDHADCCMRHLQERGGFDVVVIDGAEHRIRHTAALAWRAMALLQEELEQDLGLPLPRGAKA